MGSTASQVVPGGRVPYVPTAALVVRRAALGEQAFDERLHCGEDVDLVWRLHDAGWRVRYEASVWVHHYEPTSWRGLLRRRWRYGTAAASLATRHPGRLAPAVTRPAPGILLLLLLTRRPGAALAVSAVQGTALARRLHALGIPAGTCFLLAPAAALRTLITLGRAGTMLYAPLMLRALASRRRRMPALALLAASPLAEWLRRRPRLDPLRWTAASCADDAAYGLGVWWGCVRQRQLAPLMPKVRTKRRPYSPTDDERQRRRTAQA